MVKDDRFLQMVHYNIFNHFASLSCQRIVSENNAKVAKITDDHFLNPRSFSQPQIFLQQFCFHEIRLTDSSNGWHYGYAEFLA